MTLHPRVAEENEASFVSPGYTRPYGLVWLIQELTERSVVPKKYHLIHSQKQPFHLVAQAICCYLKMISVYSWKSKELFFFRYMKLMILPSLLSIVHSN